MTSEGLLETYRGTVYPWHCDHMGHMNVMWYVGKFDEATWNLFAHIGLDSAALRAQGSAMVAVEQHLQYKQEFFTGELCATCRLVGVHIDAKARKARPLPEALAARAREMLGNPELAAR